MTHQANIKGGVHAEQRHDSAHKHVTGQAVYVDDIPEPQGTLHIAVGSAAAAQGKITKVNLDTSFSNYF